MAIDPPVTETSRAVILPRSAHVISRSKIDPDALRILYRLHQNGHKGYLVGGSVRDLLLGKTPRDFDIGTDAHPARLRRLFRNCRIIGRRFKLAHMLFHDGKAIEVATFRKQAEVTEEGGGVNFNNYGTPEEDARRRDITINGLFYDIATFSVIDYVGGLKDLKHRVIRTIKPPAESFAEDPVRIVRVIRHAARTGFDVEAATWNAVMDRQRSVMSCSMDRLREELYKDLVSGKMEAVFELFHRSGLLYSVFPEFEIRGPGRLHERLAFLHRLLEATASIDRFVTSAEELPPQAFLLAVLLHPHFSANAWKVVPEKGCHLAVFLRERLEQVLGPILQRLRIPKISQSACLQIIVLGERIRQALYARGSIPPSWNANPYFQTALELYRADSEGRGDLLELPGPMTSRTEPSRPRRPRRRKRPGAAKQSPDRTGDG